MFPLYIMSGGKSSRFGSDKARALLHNKPLLRHVSDALAPLSSSTVVVADQADKYVDLGLVTIPDLSPHLGPMGGLQTALTHLSQVSAHEWCFLVSCDMVGFQSEWASALWKERTESAQAVAFGPDPWDSMFACYHRGLLEEVDRRIARGERAMWRLLQEVGKAVSHPLGWENVASVNSPELLKQYLSQNGAPSPE